MAGFCARTCRRCGDGAPASGASPAPAPSSPAPASAPAAPSNATAPADGLTGGVAAYAKVRCG